MGIESLLFYLFGTIAISSGVMVVLSKNPVHSAMFLILVFVNATGLLILLGVEFMAMLFLIVYVGAVAILFLFVVMMLNIKSIDENISRYLPMGAILALLFLGETYIILQEDLGTATGPLTSTINWFDNLQALSNIETVGELVFTYYFYIFLVASMILLVAMIGAIVLTQHKRNYLIAPNKMESSE